MSGYAQLAARLADRAFITDPWLDGKPRFTAAPILLARPTYDAMTSAAEAVTGLLDELCRIVAADPALLETFFRLTPVQRLMFETSFPLWHGHARADVFLRADGRPVVCEVNCDTPSGQAEAVELNRAAHEAGATGAIDPCAGFPRALAALVGGAAGRICGELDRGRRAPAVGIVYPTEMPEDLALVCLWRRELEARGYTVALGSPFNLHATPDGGVGLFGQPVDVVIRHYKTDWWGEREPLWHDEAPYADPAPLATPLALLLGAQLRGRAFVINPFGAVLPQNKRAYAFLWERRERFSAQARAVIDEYVPFTIRLEAADRQAIVDDRERWVLKSDYGCEGEEVIVGAAVSDDAWNEALSMAIPHRWVVQHRFDGVRDDEGRLANHGVFLVAGRAAGVYTRVSTDATDRRALSTPTLVLP